MLLFIKYSVSPYYVPGTVLAPGVKCELGAVSALL